MSPFIIMFRIKNLKIFFSENLVTFFIKMIRWETPNLLKCIHPFIPPLALITIWTMDIPLFQQQHSTLDHSGIIFHNLVITLAQLGDHNETNLDWEHSIGCFGIPLSCGQHIYWPYYLHKKCLFSPVHTNHIFLSTMHALLAKDVYLWAFCPPSGIEPLICVPLGRVHDHFTKSTKSLFSLKCKLSCHDSP